MMKNGWNRKWISIALPFMLFLCLLMAEFGTPTVAASSEIRVPDDYPTIQEAVDAAAPGDTVRVASGIYYEQVIVNKSISLVGEDRETTVIDGGGKGTVVYVTANHTVIVGFTIRNSGWKFGYCGIFLHGSFDSSVFGNNVINNYYSIYMRRCVNCSIFDNKVDHGILGTVLTWSSNSSVFDNSITHMSLEGLGLAECVNCSASDNNILRNWYGLGVSSCLGCCVSGNNILKNSAWGIELRNSSGNVIKSNNVNYNAHVAVEFLNSSGNMIYHNNFIRNRRQVYDWSWDEPELFHPSINVWDDGYPSGGNYWSDYNGTDLYSGSYQNETGGDGIGDTPHEIDENNRDGYPLMTPYPVRPYPPGDLNYDLTVDIKDLVIAALAFGSYPGHPSWNPVADVNDDGYVDIRDMVIIALHFGETI